MQDGQIQRLKPNPIVSDGESVETFDLEAGGHQLQEPADGRQFLRPGRPHVELLDSPFMLSVTTDAKPDIPYDDVMVLFEALESMIW